VPVTPDDAPTAINNAILSGKDIGLDGFDMLRCILGDSLFQGKQPQFSIARDADCLDFRRGEKALDLFDHPSRAISLPFRAPSDGPPLLEQTKSWLFVLGDFESDENLPRFPPIERRHLPKLSLNGDDDFS
jgi:hypothetical protein